MGGARLEPAALPLRQGDQLAPIRDSVHLLLLGLRAASVTRGRGCTTAAVRPRAAFRKMVVLWCAEMAGGASDVPASFTGVPHRLLLVRSDAEIRVTVTTGPWLIALR